MKLKLVAVAVTTLLAAGTTNAAEVYNKDETNLICTAKYRAYIISQMTKVKMVISPMLVWALKARRRLPIN